MNCALLMRICSVDMGSILYVALVVGCIALAWHISYRR